MRILVVDDDRRLCAVIKRGLLEEAYAVDLAHDGEEGAYLAEVNPYDLIILDIMLPNKDGIQVCRELRAKKVNAPILMLTAKDTVEDRVKGLDTGADDYLVKPFAFSELLARVRALLRREGMLKSPELRVGDLILNTLTRQVWRGQRPVELTTKEYVILEYLMRHPNVVVTRTMIEEHAWDYDFDSMSNLVDVYIRRLRRKIDDEKDDGLIQTVRGAGYRLKAP
ncbi:MAG: response regulator transcription factor [Dehalococcoidia bacterium]|nr:response regulator transcription factor [Dehalococcoidia bacterium]MDH4300064.1 response regulator transcription factor [Dehalococcoidia bacterium]MDH4367280.1 response regulator transcription factor [Dehalococcoidia bacterium]